MVAVVARLRNEDTTRCNPKTHDPIVQLLCNFAAYVALPLQREISETSKACTSETMWKFDD